MKQVIALATVLTMSMVGSYMIWTDDSPNVKTSGDEVMVYGANPADLSMLAWKSEKVDIVLERKSDERGDYTWVTTTERKEKRVKKPAPKPHDHEDPAGAPDAPDGLDAPDSDDAEGGDEAPEVEDPPPEIEIIITSFRGNKQAEEMWDGFAPLMALRELKPDDATEEFFGFDEPDGTIEVTRKNGTLSLIVGGETFGSRDKYVRMDNRVFLIDDQSIRPLQFGKTRLLERNLQPLGEPDTVSVLISSDAGQKTFVHQNRADRAAAKWTTEADPDTEHQVGTWLGKVYKMRAKKYVDEGDIEGTLEVAFTYELKGETESWPVQILKDDSMPTNYYAKPSYLRGMVELTRSLASDAVDDLEQIMAD